MDSTLVKTINLITICNWNIINKTKIRKHMHLKHAPIRDIRRIIKDKRDCPLKLRNCHLWIWRFTFLQRKFHSHSRFPTNLHGIVNSLSIHHKITPTTNCRIIHNFKRANYLVNSFAMHSFPTRSIILTDINTCNIFTGDNKINLWHVYKLFFTSQLIFRSSPW